MVGATALALTGCGGGSGAAGGGGTLRLALNQTEEHPSFIALEDFGNRLTEGTDGRWGIEVYANETLGAQQEALQLVGADTVDMAIVAGPQLENLNEEFVAFNLPLVFDSIDHQMNVINNPDITGDLYSSLEDQNISVLGGLTAGTRNIYTSEGPITEPADLDGMKIRVQESPIHTEMIERMGGSATPMAYGEVYTALQSGVLDGAENNEVSYMTQKHYEVAGYFARTEHLIVPDYLVMSTERLADMSEADRAVFDAEWSAAIGEHTELWTGATDEAIAEAEAAGVQFNDVDDETFRAAVEPLVDQSLTSDTIRELYETTRAAAE
ncbi:TRAP transporter substrate-binding protein [Spinactinospora alkalitolerans]